MKENSLAIFMDNRRVGHAYIRLSSSDTKEPAVYGFYPEKYDEKKEVLLGNGQVKKDDERLSSVLESQDDSLVQKDFDLDQEEFERAISFLENARNEPHYYFLIGYNCIDFIQDLFRKAKDAEAANFVDAFSGDELEMLGEVGEYARLRYL